MSRKISPEDKHKTGRAAQTSDFVKHACPAAVTKVWKAGREVDQRIVQKPEFARLEGNAEMIAVNTRSHDACPFCGLDVDADGWTSCTDQDVEALSK
jgi:hypothetical protein